MNEIVLDKSIEKKLLEYQIPHTIKIIKSLQDNNRALDSSDTGTGKTYSAVAACKHLNLKPLIICPKSVISSWMTVFKHFDCPYYGVSNHALIKNCRYYPQSKSSILKRERCPFIKRIKRNPSKKDIEFAKCNDKRVKKRYCYVWKFPKDMILIFDEAHRCKNKNTQNSELLFTSSNYDVKILLISATVADKPETFVLAGYCLGLYPCLKDAIPWILDYGCDDKVQNAMKKVHDKIYPDYAARMRIKDLGSLFPTNQVIAQCYDMECAPEIQEMYDLIDKTVQELKKKQSQSRGIGKIIYARMKIEILKTPTFIELAKKYLEEENAVAIFVNFTRTLENIAHELDTDCLVYGEQTLETRNENIKKFCDDKSRIIICNIRAGGLGISLHDTHGNYPRVSIISPSWSAIDVLQSIGRIFRANTKTPVRQRIVYCKGTIEENLCESMKDKIVNIANLNDGSLESYEIENLITVSNAPDEEEQLTEFEQTFLRVRTLEAKKKRIQKELTHINDELNTLNLILATYIQ